MQTIKKLAEFLEADVVKDEQDLILVQKIDTTILKNRMDLFGHYN